jgi:phosphate transport system substrate-binding protein
MKLKNGFILVLCFTMLSGCGRSKTEKTPDKIQGTSINIISGNISVSGAYALAPLAKKWADEFMKLHPGVKIEIIETGTGQGVEALISKKVQLAMISRPLQDEERDAGIWIVPVAKDGIAPIVNRMNFKKSLQLINRLNGANFSIRPVQRR